VLDLSVFSEIDLFRDLPETCLDVLERESNVLDCRAGHLFFQPAQTGRVIFVLEKGAVRLFRSYGGRKRTITVLHPPALFGILGCFGGGKYYSSAEAVEPSRVRMISRDSIQAVWECAPQATHRLVDLVSERCAYILHKMEAFARKGLIPLLATLLIEKADNGIVAGMTHQDLADHLGLHRESITATLGELRRAGIIKIERRKIRILHAERLQRAAQE
jgi:CRP/FNR family transcriptional regulator, cyclic AMP receptor protein